MFVLLLGQEQHQCQDPGATVLPRAWDFSQELRTYSEFKTTQAPGSWWTSPKALLSAWQGFFLLLPSPSLLCSHYQLTTFFFFHVLLWALLEICLTFHTYICLPLILQYGNSILFKKKLLLFNYSCLHFLPISPPHPSQSHLSPPLLPSPLILSMCPLQ